MQEAQLNSHCIRQWTGTSLPFPGYYACLAVYRRYMGPMQGIGECILYKYIPYWCIWPCMFHLWEFWTMILLPFCITNVWKTVLNPFIMSGKVLVTISWRYIEIACSEIPFNLLMKIERCLVFESEMFEASTWAYCILATNQCGQLVILIVPDDDTLSELTIETRCTSDVIGNAPAWAPQLDTIDLKLECNVLPNCSHTALTSTEHTFVLHEHCINYWHRMQWECGPPTNLSQNLPSTHDEWFTHYV